MIRFVLAAVMISTPAFAQSQADLYAKAREIHERVLTIDTHVDIPFDFATPAYDMMKPGPRGQQVHIPTMIEGGLDAPFLIVYMGQGERTVAGYAKAAADAFTKFSAIHRAADELYKDKIELAYTAADVRRIYGAGKKPIIIGMENGYAVGKDLRLLDIYHGLGARYLGLLHNGHNDLGDSAQPNANEPAAEHNGLSPLGKQVVEKLNELGIMADISHASMKTALDILAVSKAPVIASHSAVKGVYDHPRNVSDEVLDAIKRSGGVVQIVAFDPYLRATPPEKTKAVQALQKTMGMRGNGDIDKLQPGQLQAYEAEMANIENQWPKADVTNLVDHMDYAIKRIGIDHVGISSDFNGGGGIRGWGNAAETLNVTLELVRRGYTEDQIAKLWGGNLLRVMEQVEANAKRPRKRR
ncbi:MAG: dipeptidase [Proteobacteria bacterium]|nr:dipeptidase [Pseudomonadota bacterium]